MHESNAESELVKHKHCLQRAWTVPFFKNIVSLYCFCRYGALSGPLKAHMRAWSQILTARQDSESSAPSPTHMNSQSTLAAKLMLPWTLNISVSFGDALLLGCCSSARSKMDVGKNVQRHWQSLSGWGNARTTETTSALPLNAYWAPHQSKMCLLCTEDCNLQCFSTRTVGLANSFPQTLKLDVAINVLLEHWKPNRWLHKNGRTTL